MVLQCRDTMANKKCEHGIRNTTVECVTKKLFVHTIDEKTSVESVVRAFVASMGEESIIVQSVV